MDDVAAFTQHGGALDAARRRFPHAPEPWLDLSTGINPQPYPLGSLPATAWTRLPELADLRRLEAIAARRYGARSDAEVVAAPGTQALIQLLPSQLGGADVRILGPTYGEFARVFRRADRHVRVVPTIDALAGADVAIVVNPNNPDGRLLPPASLSAIAGRVGRLVVDEAFIDLLPVAASVVPFGMGGRTMVLRSFGKTFGLAGVRLGFAIASIDLACRIRESLGPWPVSGPALAMGAAALADEAWLEAARTRAARDTARLAYLLRQTGATPVGGTLLFNLASHPGAPSLFTRLAEVGILCRPFSEEPSWLRFGLPGDEADWDRFEAALRRFR